MEYPGTFYHALFVAQAPAASQYFDLRKTSSFAEDADQISASAYSTRAEDETLRADGSVSRSQRSPQVVPNPATPLELKQIRSPDDLERFLEVSIPIPLW